MQSICVITCVEETNCLRVHMVLHLWEVNILFRHIFVLKENINLLKIKKLGDHWHMVVPSGYILQYKAQCQTGGDIHEVFSP